MYAANRPSTASTLYSLVVHGSGFTTDAVADLSPSDGAASTARTRPGKGCSGVGLLSRHKESSARTKVEKAKTMGIRKRAMRRP